MRPWKLSPEAVARIAWALLNVNGLLEDDA